MVLVNLSSLIKAIIVCSIGSRLDKRDNIKTLIFENVSGLRWKLPIIFIFAVAAWVIVGMFFCIAFFY